MNPSQCPICFGQLTAIDVAPCWDCGHDPKELGHLVEGLHTFSEFSAFDQRLVLCDFCEVDFGSYYAEHFGLPGARLVGEVLSFQRDVDLNVASQKDKYCVQCNRRLAFLNFLAAVRQRHSAIGA